MNQESRMFSFDYLLISDECKKKKKISGKEVGDAGASKADFDTRT